MIKKIFIIQTTKEKTLQEVIKERESIQNYIAFTLGFTEFTEINATIFMDENGSEFENFMKQLIDMSDTVVAQSGYEISELCSKLYSYAESSGKEIIIKEN